MPMKPAGLPELWRVRDAAEYFGVKENAIYGWIKRRTIPYTRVGRTLYIPTNVLDQFVKGRTHLPKTRKAEEEQP
jgi:excisionase family DNA binding protein